VKWKVNKAEMTKAESRNPEARARAEGKMGMMGSMGRTGMGRNKVGVTKAES
jgi:hypothetical protein